MGRTIPTATEMLREIRDDYKEYRSRLPKKYQKAFDEMWSLAKMHTDAIMMGSPQHPNIIELFLISIIFEHHLQLTELKEKLDF